VLQCWDRVCCCVNIAAGVGVGRLNGTVVLGQGVLLCKYSSRCWCWQAERCCSVGTGCAAV